MLTNNEIQDAISAIYELLLRVESRLTILETLTRHEIADIKKADSTPAAYIKALEEYHKNCAELKKDFAPEDLLGLREALNGKKCD